LLNYSTSGCFPTEKPPNQIQKFTKYLWRKVRRTWRPRNQETRDRLQILESTITLMTVRIMKAIGSRENRDSMIEEVESHGNDLVVSLDLEVAIGEMDEKISDLSLARKMLRIVIVPKTKKSNP